MLRAMKLILIVLALAAAGWYWFIGGRKLDEQMVRDYYMAQKHAVLSRDVQAQCELYSRKLQLHLKSRMGGQAQDVTLDKKAACEQLQTQHTEQEDEAGKDGSDPAPYQPVTVAEKVKHELSRTEQDEKQHSPSQRLHLVGTECLGREVAWHRVEGQRARGEQPLADPWC